jgi:hypothetical protein
MPMKRIILAIAACFVLLSAGRYLIHDVWLADTYLETAAVWRDQESMLSHLWVLYVANLILAGAAVLIYIRGVEPKPWLGQGIRFGILLALVTAVPQSLVEWVVLPVPYQLALRWIIGEGVLAVLAGVLAAVICQPVPN